MPPPIDVIVAEDNMIQRTYLSRLIQKLGYNVLEAEDGAEALALTRETSAQIVITDYQMPGLNGVELTRALRALKADHYVHIILVTGSAEDDVRAEALEAGADDFLSKGRDPAALKARLRVASRLIEHARDLSEQHRILVEANARITEDLKAAAQAQRKLLPTLREDILGTRIASAFVPSAGVSGDMFGCCALDDTRLGFYAVDVSGHGIHASLLSVAIGHLITPEYFANTVLDAGDTPDPAQLVAELNARFTASDSDDYFTMFCGVLDSETGRLDYCQAAYPSPLHLSPEGRAGFVGDGGFPVGMFPDVPFENGTVDIARGTTLLICSDAAAEAENAQNVPFGNNRLKNTLLSWQHVDTDALPARLVACLTDWRDGHPLEDDLTVIALKRM